MRTAKGKGTARSTTKDDSKPVDDRKVGKRKAPADSKRTARKEKRAKKDPNKPKRPPSAFFVFLEEFRQTFKKENPNVKAVSAVGKAGGQKWKSMSQDEKAPYEAKAARKKSEYEKLMNAYNKKQDEASDESERSKSEVNDDEDEASAEEGHEEKGKGKGKGKKTATLEEQEEEDEGEEQGEEDEDEDEEDEEEDDGDEDKDD